MCIGRLRLAANGDGPVVAGHAITGDALVVKGPTGKGSCGVAERAIECGWNVP